MITDFVYKLKYFYINITSFNLRKKEEMENDREIEYNQKKMQLEIKKWKTIEINKESDKCGKKNRKIKKEI